MSENTRSLDSERVCIALLARNDRGVSDVAGATKFVVGLNFSACHSERPSAAGLAIPVVGIAWTEVEEPCVIVSSALEMTDVDSGVVRGEVLLRDQISSPVIPSDRPPRWRSSQLGSRGRKSRDLAVIFELGSAGNRQSPTTPAVSATGVSGAAASALSFTAP
jgi:hypothetical protein